MSAGEHARVIGRRQFLQTAFAAIAVGGLLEIGPGLVKAADGNPPPTGKSPPLIGIQVGAVSFVDEGVDAVLDVFQQQGQVNAIFLATFTYGRGIAGRQVPGQPLPDHGKQEYDEKTFRGGNYATPHPQFYEKTVIKDTKAPDHRALDILELVLPKAHQRGMKVYCWYEDNFDREIPNTAPLRN